MLVVRHAVVGPFQENSYLVACDRTGEAMLVDPGGELPRVLALAQPEGFRPARIVCTHGHIDHVSGVAEAKAALGVPFLVHPLEHGWLEALPTQAEMFGFDAAPVPAPDAALEDGATFALGEEEVRVIHTPGHTRGGCCLFFPTSRALLTGDTLFAGSVGRTDLPGGDWEALRSSIVEKLFPLGDDVTIHPGHGEPSTLGAERKTNPFVGEQRGRGRFY
jgi:hydroxyacylglutathione hydrolase